MLCFFCLILPKITFAGNPAVIINETMNIQITVSMNKISGDNQQATMGTRLAQVLVVKTSYTNGTGVSGLPISFSITSQPEGATGTKLSANQVNTNAQGQASVTLTLGNKPGQYQVSASNPNVSNSPLVFTAIGISPDPIPPAAITDLQVTATQSTSVILSWTAPGDDGNSGTAAEYDVRYSTSQITESNWVQAAQCAGEPIPQIAGIKQTFQVTGLTPATTYYFAIKTRDEVPNWSGLSNIAVGTTMSQITITITQVTPPNNNISFTTQPGENSIRCIADIKPDSLDEYNSQIEWEIDDDPRDTYTSGNPNDTQRGNDVSLQITIPPVPTAPRGRGFPLSYRIIATVTINTTLCTSTVRYITQDERDQCRQEYIDMRKNRTPNRSEFVNAQTYVNPGHFSFNQININQQYSWAIFTIAQHLENIRNRLPHTKVMPVNSGYRNPIRNDSIPNSGLNSLHIYGRAADIANQDWNNDKRVDIADRVLMRRYVWAEGGKVEDIMVTYTWVHMEW